MSARRVYRTVQGEGRIPQKIPLLRSVVMLRVSPARDQTLHGACAMHNLMYVFS